jgi:hypothetical protein
LLVAEGKMYALLSVRPEDRQVVDENYRGVGCAGPNLVHDLDEGIGNDVKRLARVV